MAEFRLEEATIEQLHAAIKAGEVTCVQIVQRYIDRARAYNGVASALVTEAGTPVPPAAGTVRAGAMLLQKAANELLPGYTRYYLSQAGLSTSGDLDARLVASFPLPDAIRQAIERQLDVVLGGI